MKDGIKIFWKYIKENKFYVLGFLVIIWGALQSPSNLQTEIIGVFIIASYPNK